MAEPAPIFIPYIIAVVEDEPVADKLWIKLPETTLAPVPAVKYKPIMLPAKEA